MGNFYTTVQILDNEKLGSKIIKLFNSNCNKNIIGHHEER